MDQPKPEIRLKWLGYGIMRCLLHSSFKITHSGTCINTVPSVSLKHFSPKYSKKILADKQTIKKKTNKKKKTTTKNKKKQQQQFIMAIFWREIILKTRNLLSFFCKLEVRLLQVLLPKEDSLLAMLLNFYQKTCFLVLLQVESQSVIIYCQLSITQ